jgi:hypothetical protein
MSSATRLAFLGLALFLCIFPLTIHKPGMPGSIKADEAAYYLMARSLVEDGDLRCELADIERLAEEFPFQGVENLILMTDDGWRTAFFGKPYIYSLLAAPLVAPFKANGLVSFNMLMLVGMIWLGALYLRRYNSEGLALAFSAGFFVLSNTWPYVFWMHTEIFNMFCATLCLYLAFVPAPDGLGAGQGRLSRLVDRLRGGEARAWISGAVIVAAAYNKPVLGALGLPAFWIFTRAGGWRGAARWVGGAVASGLLLCAVSIAFTGHPSAYLGVERAGFKVEDFDRVPFEPESIGYTAPGLVAGAGEAAASGTSEVAEAAVGSPATEEPPQNSWWWIFRAPEIDHRALVNIRHFFVGRHTGLLLYSPFVALSFLLFLVHARRSSERWLILAGAALVAAFFLFWIPFNWHGGGGFVGNRYFVNALPVFLFLVTRIAPAWLLPAGWALGGLLVGSLVFTPYGALVPQPTLQWHTRNVPYPLLPLELSLGKQVPGYRGSAANGVAFLGRRDLFLPRRDEMWIQGREKVEIWVRSYQPLVRPMFRVETVQVPNSAVIRLGDDVERLNFESTEPGRNATVITLEPTAPEPGLTDDGLPIYAYRMVVETERMKIKSYRLVQSRDDEYGFLVGVILTYLGTAEQVAQDLYHARWVEAAVPPEMPAGRDTMVDVVVRNDSAFEWPNSGPTRVSLSYHWLDAGGRSVLREGARSLFATPVEAGKGAGATMKIQAPAEPGDYVLELDLVREQVSWFSDRNPASTRRVPVKVVASAPAR